MKTITKGIHDERDPRTTLDVESLEEAQANRFPVVASQKRGKDGFAIWGGMLGAVALGGLTLIFDVRSAAIGQPSRGKDRGSRNCRDAAAGGAVICRYSG